jgi:hypothetical protein
MRPQVRECCLRIQNYAVLGENILVASFRGGWQACMTCSWRTWPGSFIIKPHPRCNHFSVNLDAIPIAIGMETAWSLKHLYYPTTSHGVKTLPWRPKTYVLVMWFATYILYLHVSYEECCVNFIVPFFRVASTRIIRFDSSYVLPL